MEVKTDYVRNHLGYFLWDKRPVWSKPVAGWCSWMAYLQDVNEADVIGAADFLDKNLKAYGYDVVQIDDGYQRAMQHGNDPLKPGERLSERWTVPNEKFPSGLASLASEDPCQGPHPRHLGRPLRAPGPENARTTFTKDGQPLRGPWVNWAMNGLEKGADEAYLDTIRTLKKQGWDYFKIDTLRHVLYDNYRLAPEYWSRRGTRAWRRPTAGSSRRSSGSRAGPTSSPAGAPCPSWRACPTAAASARTCQPDVPSMRKAAKYIAQFHHLNDVVWRNDPDYMCLRLAPEKARAWASFVSLAGGHLMVSDKPSDYTPEHVRLMRQVAPPLVTKPLNAAPLPPDPEYFTLNASKFGEEWAVVSRQAWAPKAYESVLLSRFGLSGPCLAFDFWESKFLGVVSEAPFHGLKEGECQVLGLRPLQNHPQVLGTDRHIGQGAYELESVAWRGDTLSGRFRGGPGERLAAVRPRSRGLQGAVGRGGFVRAEGAGVGVDV